MFDLNLICVDVSPSTQSETMMIQEEKHQEEAMDDSASGTSVSSIVNAEEASVDDIVGDEDSISNNASSAFTFHILSNRDKAQSPEVVTKELFPENGGIVWEFSTGSSSLTSSTMKKPPQWLNLSLPDPGGGDSDSRTVQQQKARKSRRGPRSRSSQYRGVTFYRRTGRWESHIWDCGKQVYLGGFDTAHAAARAYDRAAIKFRGIDADINFNTSDYDEDMKQMKHLNKQEFIHTLRRQNTGYAGSSKYRAVTSQNCGQWEARIGQLLGKKAYAKAATQYIGRETITNFDPSICQGGAILGSKCRGTVENLDLSLGLSHPPRKGTTTVFGHYDRSFVDSELSIRARPPVEKSASAATGGQTSSSRAMADKRPYAFSGKKFNFVPDDEEIAKKQKSESNFLPRFSNWSWPVQDHRTMSTTPLSIAPSAASSGFSSSRIYTSTATPPEHPRHQIAFNLPQ